jgi:hypothetical protein
METMLFVNKKYYEYVGTSLQMMKFFDFEVMHRFDQSSAFHNAEKNDKFIRIDSYLNI